MMTREEIDRHVAGILALRKRKNRSAGQRRRTERGYDTVNDFNSSKRRVTGVSWKNVDADVGAVDATFIARQRAGWLPRGGRD